MKKYRVIKDLQGGEFGMGRDYTAEQWLEQMEDWALADGRDSDDLETEVMYWQNKIKQGKEKELIDYIAEVWTLEFEEVKE